MPQAGALAPDFRRPDAAGQLLSLKELTDAGKRVVLFFYPKDETVVCTKEACLFRDHYQEFERLNAVVIGISTDSDASHLAFAKNHGLPYHLISDPQDELRRAYDVKKNLLLIPGRTTFVIDHERCIVRRIDSATSAQRHVRGALKAVRELAAPTR
jgi:peroxiredoxin Q/BCP